MSLAALAGRSLARIAGVLAGVTLLLVALQAALVFVASLQEEAQSFDLIAKLAPSFVQRQFGSSFTLFMSFSGLATFGYFHPVVMLLFTLFTTFVATELAADVEGGQVDLLMARPISRQVLVTRSLLLVLFIPVTLVSLMLLATALALRLFAPAGAQWPSGEVLRGLATHLVALAWCFGAIGLAVAAGARRRAGALGSVAIAAVSLYLLDLLAPAWRALQPFAIVSPFHYYQGPSVLAGTADNARDFTVLATIALAATAFAFWRFGRRDL
jgi:ABC-2 type transport system permease protein